MNYGYLFKKRKTDSGYGLPWMSAQEKLSVYSYMFKNTIKKACEACEIHCLLFNANVRFHIPVSGIHMQNFSRQDVIGLH